MDISINNGIVDIAYDVNGIMKKKTTTLQTFAKLLSSNVENSTGLLPVGCRLSKERDGMTTMFLEFGPSKRHIIYKNKQSKEIFTGVVPTPPMLHVIGVSNTPGDHKVMYSSVYAIKEHINSLSNFRLYHAPFPNVGGAGGICWGNTFTRVKFKTLMEFSNINDLFFSAEFNSDIHPSIAGGLREEDLFRKIKDQDEFDLNLLVSQCNISSIV